MEELQGLLIMIRGFEWNISRPRNPAEVKDAPAMTGSLTLAGCNQTRCRPQYQEYNRNGNCMLPVLTASSPNPSGAGFLARIGIV